MSFLIIFGLAANFILAIFIMIAACLVGGGLAALLLRYAELSPIMEE